MRKEWESHLEGSFVAEDIYLGLSEKERQEGFIGNLAFGTAGIRGVIGLGPNRLNKYTVQKVSQGIAQFLRKKHENPVLVIGFDTRHFSVEFSETIAETLSFNNVKTYVTKSYTSTPELSFLVREHEADLGIMITASHNPPEYNGIKVYGSDGSQLIDEPAATLSEYINAIDDVFNIESMDFKEAMEKGLIEYVSEDMLEDYKRRVIQFIGEIPESDLSVVFSSLHGTSVPVVPDILDALNFEGYTLVPSQCEADGSFPTTSNPNPESREAFDESLKIGKDVNADLLLATDPDADRLGIVVKHDEDYVHLTGNQIGVLLVNRRMKEVPEGKTPVAIKSIVTSDLGTKIVEAHDGKMIEVLTGFKYIGEQILNLEDDSNYAYMIGYEESYGYMMDPFVRDKDAIQVVPYVIKYASELKQQGRTLIDELEDIYREYGRREEHLFSHTFPGVEGKEKIASIMKSFRAETPLEINGRKVVKIEDFLLSKSVDVDSNDTTDIDLPAADVVKLHFEDGWIALRPSGTEPKIKLYVSIDTDDIMTEAQAINDLVFG